MKRLMIAIAALLFAAGTSFGQLNNIEFFKGGVHDANILLKEYVSPWATALGTSLNGGWYNTAKPHKLGGFDITFTVNLTVVPSSSKTFDLSKLNLEKLTLSDPAKKIAPTIAGKGGAGPMLEYDYAAQPMVSFASPGGTNVGIIPLPMIQAGIGLVKGTEIIGRFLPTLNILDAGSIGLWGIGLKHSIIQWLPGSKLIPIELTLFGGYTKLTSKADVSFGPDEYTGATVTTTKSFADQEVRMDVSAWTVNLLVSKSLAVVTLYGGAGYCATKANLGLKGNYPLYHVDPAGPNLVVADEDVYKDPIDIEIKSLSGLRLNAGFRLKLAIVTIHADYTYASYSVYTAGLGFSFR
jgi:hypothetical protein